MNGGRAIDQGVIEGCDGCCIPNAGVDIIPKAGVNNIPNAGVNNIPNAGVNNIPKARVDVIPKGLIRKARFTTYGSGK